MIIAKGAKQLACDRQPYAIEIDDGVRVPSLSRRARRIENWPSKTWRSSKAAVCTTAPPSWRRSCAHWPRVRTPHLLETSLPGVFAVGDVRGGNIKGVASAVGEGSIAIAFVHQVLHE